VHGALAWGAASVLKAGEEGLKPAGEAAELRLGEVVVEASCVDGVAEGGGGCWFVAHEGMIRIWGWASSAVTILCSDR